MKWFEYELDGVVKRVPAVKDAGRLWFHWQGRTYVVEPRPARSGPRGAKSVAGTGLVAAPMPGKITRVAVELDQTVTKGQVLVVMEAMKMEYTLEADVAGRVTEVNVAGGETVGQGATLIRVMPL